MSGFQGQKQLPPKFHIIYLGNKSDDQGEDEGSDIGVLYGGAYLFDTLVTGMGRCARPQQEWRAKLARLLSASLLPFIELSKFRICSDSFVLRGSS